MKKKIIICILILIVVALSIVLYFKFNDKKYRVQFINDKEIEVVYVKEGEVVNEPTDPVKDGYEFLGWFNEEKIFDFNTKINKDIKLDAHWNKIEEKKNNDKFVVTFKNGDNTIAKREVEKDKIVKEPKKPSKENYEFLGWYNGDKKFDFNSKITSDLELTAKWQKKDISKQEVRYDVSFDTDGGSLIETKSVLKNSTVVKPPSPTKEGYYFVVWQLDGKDYDFNTKITKNITLKAVWMKLVESKEYTFSWEYVDKTVPIDVKIQPYENGKKIDIKAIYRAKDGKKICGSSAVMNKVYLKDVDELIFELKDGTKVNAKKL